jgi:hypothetical protein
MPLPEDHHLLCSTKLLLIGDLALAKPALCKPLQGRLLFPHC